MEKIAIISSYKPTGQRICALLNVFNFESSIFIEKLTKIALKRQKLKISANFLIFGVILGPWGQLKKSINLHKYISHEAKYL